jgi:glycosyltransferase involved in cell wall biosynthesis
MELSDDFAAGRDAAGPGVVMVLESVFPTRGGGGAENQTGNLARYFIGCGMPVRIVVPRWFGDSEPEREIVQGIAVERLSYRRIRLLGTLMMLWRLATWLYRERHSYAAIHAHIAGKMAAVCCVMGRLLGKPVLVKYTGFTDIDATAGRRSWALRLRTAALRRATWIQATSRRAAEALLREGYDSQQVRLVPNAVDVVRFRPQPELRAAACARLGVADAAIVAIYSGRFDPVKGLDVLIQAWERAFAGREDHLLLIVGTGLWQQEIDAMHAAAARLRCGPQLRFLGPQSRVEDIMLAGDFAVLPSRFEGLSNSLLEFMASGLPVLGTRVSGTEDLIDDGVSGLLCAPDDVESLAAGLQDMVARGAAVRSAMGASARARVLECAAIDSIGPRIAALYGLPHLGQRSGAAGGVECAA